MSEIIIIHNTETNEIIEREANSQELEQLEKDRLETEKEAAQIAERAAAKAALLERLGITEEEARLLLG